MSQTNPTTIGLKRNLYPGKILLVGVIVWALLAMKAAAAIIVSYIPDMTNAYVVGGSGSMAQSFAIPGGNSYDHITFNWGAYDGGTPLAAGTLFLLNQEYLGTPNGLSGSTPGFIAQTSTITNQTYVFAPAITLSNSTKYWVYMGGNTTLSNVEYGVNNPFAGGSAYEQFINPDFVYMSDDAEANPVDFSFVLRGTVLPPVLRIIASSGQLALRWPGSLTNFILESKSNLLPAVQWETVTNSLTIVSQECSVTVSNRYPAQFFRLLGP